MAAKKVKDLAVKTGSYTKDGQEKGRYENVGALMKMDDGSFFVLLKRTFNPAGVPVEDGRDQIIVSVFDLKDADGGSPQRQQSSPPQSGGSSGPRGGNVDDDIPFLPYERRQAV